MARIRSIKPEFPQSESMGNVSRDARLTFIQIWTLADDEGRLRGNSRMLASLLFPYDDDAPALIEGWLSELEREGCLVRYKAGSQSYIEVCNWLIHQKIDKPSRSKIPSFVESSRCLANPRERSSEDQGSKDQGSKYQGGDSREPDGNAPPSDDDKSESAGQPSKGRKVTFKAFCDACVARNEKLLTDYEPLWNYAESVGIETEWIEVAWWRFKARYLHDANNSQKRYIDWRQVFLNACRDNWFKLWALPSGSDAAPLLTSNGELSLRDYRAAMQKVAA